MPALTEEQRKELFQKLTAEREGRSGREMGSIIGGVTEGLTNIATAGTGVTGQGVGDVARQIGAAQDEEKSENTRRWQSLLNRDRQVQQDKYQKERDIKSDEFKQAGLDIQKERADMMKQKGTSPQTKAFDFMNTPQGLVRVNRVTGEQELMQQATPKEPKVKQPPAGVATQVGELESANKILEDLQQTHAQLDKGVVASGMDYLTSRMGVPNTAGEIYNSNRIAAAQGIGKILEGGKLTDVDFDKYLNMMPGPLDTEESAKQKLDNVRQLLKRKQEGTLTGLEGAQYDVSKFEDQGMDDVNQAAEQLEDADFPRTVRKDGQMATVSNADELAEAQAEGWE